MEILKLSAEMLETEALLAIYLLLIAFVVVLEKLIDLNFLRVTS